MTLLGLHAVKPINQSINQSDKSKITLSLWSIHGGNSGMILGCILSFLK